MTSALGNTLSADNQDSPIGAIGGKIQSWTDPLSWLTGGKSTDIISHDIPKAINQGLQPIAQPINKLDEAINPLRKIDFVNNLANTAYAKPGDAIGMAIGSYFAAPALAAAYGGAGAGAGGGGAALAGTGATDAGAGAGGLSGFLGGPAAFGDAGLTGGVGASGSGLAGATAGDLGGALGASPTGLFSGLLPGGGMTGTASGALGGGLSGEVAGLGGIGSGASMGGISSSGILSKLLNQGEKQAFSQATQQQQQPIRPAQNFSHGGSFKAPNTSMYMPTDAITSPMALGGGGAQSLLQQIIQQRSHPFGT